MVLCTIENCGRKHAAHGFCLMHYKRVQKHGTPEYKWGGKEVGRKCLHCDRPIAARDLCMRHYQMWHRHGNALYADLKKVAGMPAGVHMRRGYRITSPVVNFVAAVTATAMTERSDKPHRRAFDAQGFRTAGVKPGYRKDWEHRKVANAKPGQIVHHIDGNPLNNELVNLHVFNSPAEHALAHRSLEKAAYQLLQCKTLFFDSATGCYSLSQSADLSK